MRFSPKPDRLNTHGGGIGWQLFSSNMPPHLLRLLRNDFVVVLFVKFARCWHLSCAKVRRKLREYLANMSSYEAGSELVALGMAIPPLIGNPYNGYINPYYWVDDHPLLYGNNGSLDPSTYEARKPL